MTREEQIRQYLKERNIPITSLEANSIIEGAKWADEHPVLTEEEQIGLEEINLQKSITKEAMQAVCKEHNTTIKEVVIYKLNKTIAGLQKIRDKISNDEIATNDDWGKASEPLTSILNALSNSWYNR